LIITYYFPPFNGVPGWRPYSWSNHFASYGIRPTVVTRHWEGDEKTWEDSIKERSESIKIKRDNSNTIIQLPYVHSFYKKLHGYYIFKIYGLSKLYYFLLLCFGRLSIEIDA